MTKQKSLTCFMFMPAAIILLVLLTTTAGAAQKTGTNQTAVAKASVLTLKTDQIDEIVDISTFLRNTRGEVFLFSRARGKIFKFKPDGTFDQSFCRFGEGPGEIARVFSMFHNPANDFLYLPEYYSNRGKINAYDSCGKFQGLMNVELSLQKKDHVWQILFLKDGTFFIITQIRINWKPEGKFFITQDEYKIDYFDKDGRLLAEIFKTILDDELSNAIRWGGPQIFFKPSMLTALMPDGNIALAKNDENTVTIYNRLGKAIETITLEIDREKLSDKLFNETKENALEKWKGKEDERMLKLVKHMIKLEYKTIYSGFYIAGNHFILKKGL
jgi:hypothetical protein